MLSSRPLLYLSLPGVVFILGVFWYRRRNKYYKSTAEDKENNLPQDITANVKVDKPEVILSQKTSKQPTKSVNINEPPVLNEENSAKIFGKSTPIKIIQNRSPNSDTLRSKIKDTEHKIQQSINVDFENLTSVNLPDSVNNCKAFFSRNVNCYKDDAVVIKATNTPKISPKSSFFESKYVDHSELNISSEIECSDSFETKITPPVENGNESNTSQLQLDDSNIVNKKNNASKKDDNVSSPSMSLCSVQSGDSGKGASLPRSEAIRAKASYEFLYPVTLLGYLQGRHGTFLNKIKTNTNADISFRRYPYSSKVRVCVIEGNEEEVNAALKMIRQRLPEKRYPNFTMQRIHYVAPLTIVPLSTQSLLNLQLNLIEGINNDVVVSNVISGNHVFVQHPLHPTYPSLDVLQKCLYESYNKAESPLLPCIEISAVCVLEVNSIWYRVQIIEQDPCNEHRCLVKLLDFGGYMNVHFNELRQIRSDFMGLPFQATECILSNIEPTELHWCAEATETLCTLTRGILLQAQVAGYNSQNIPEIYLFACLGPNNVVFINKELVARKLANWVDLTE